MKPQTTGKYSRCLVNKDRAPEHKTLIIIPATSISSKICNYLGLARSLGYLFVPKADITADCFKHFYFYLLYKQV